ncbi:Protein CBG12969 [Caenorhabditis briggsae]|uniref:ABC-type xenobiotic transporter n=1 Tax=Caenorhabditis briggsae TaxID=6238 RepID=A8XGS7_CAEBR|nr:Protein CBG12969 [Caenorhabditis briggsae]CAP31851.1 Protein CBG12969 [Caenorhabditis briggsae]
MNRKREKESTISPSNSQSSSSSESSSSNSFSYCSLLRYSNKVDRLLLGLGIFLSISQGCCSSLNAILFRDLTDVLISGQGSYTNQTFDHQQFNNETLNIIHTYFLYGTLLFSLSFVSMCCWHTFCERQIFKIRVAYFSALLRQDWEWFDQNDSGAAIVRMNDGLERVRDGLGDKLGVIIAYLTHFFCGLSLAFYLSVEMTIVTLIITPAFILPIIISRKMISKVTFKELEAYESAATAAGEVISGIKTVVSFNGEQKEINRYSKFLSKAMYWGLWRASLSSFEGLLGHSSCVFQWQFHSGWWGTRLVLKGSITPGTTLAVFWAVNGAIYFVGQAIPHLTSVSSCYSAAVPVFQIIDRTVILDGTSDKGLKLSKVKGKVKFENVWFKYPARQKVNVLKGISLHANPGENIALVGHSGSGKSTTAALMMHFYELNGGKISIDDTNIDELNLSHLRNIVGIVSQEPLLFADTVENNMRLGAPDLDDNEMEYYCKLANAHDFIEQLPNGYKTAIGNGGVELSGGQRQRIAIARTLARKPSILILDEATSALDSESESLVQIALENAAEGRTTITIAHRLGTIRNCNRIYVFDDGKIVEVGSHQELMEKDGHYAKMVQSQEIEVGNRQESTMEEYSFESRRESCDSKSSRQKFSKKTARSCSLTSEKLLSDISPLPIGEENEQPSTFLEILRYTKPEWGLLAISILISVLRGFNYPIYSILYGRMFRILSTGTDEEKSSNSGMNAIYLTALGIYALIVTMAAGCLIGYVGERLTKRLRILLFTNILRQDGEYFDVPEHAPGRLITRLSTDAPNIRAAIDQRLADVIQGFSAVFCGIAIAFWFSPTMALMGLVNVGVLISLQGFITHVLKKRGEKDSERSEEPSRLAIEAVEQHRTVQYLTREQSFVKKFADGMHPIHIRNLQRGILQSISYALSTSYTSFSFAIGYRFGLLLVDHDLANPFTVFQVIESLNSSSPSLLALGSYIPEFVRAQISAGLLFQMLRYEPKIDSNTGKKTTLDSDISLKNVYFGYQVSGRKMILKDFTLKIESGKTTAIVGASGCGKSTTIQLLERFYDPIAGRIDFGSTNLRDLNLKHLRSQVALVEQEPTLFNYSIRKNIAYGLESIKEGEVIQAAKIAHAHEFITSLPEGYDTIVGEGGSKLSGGQKQRIAIARAIVRNPKILLLDEAMSALDVESERLVQEALEKAKEGRTCVVIAHRLTTIRGALLILIVFGSASF